MITAQSVLKEKIKNYQLKIQEIVAQKNNYAMELVVTQKQKEPILMKESNCITTISHLEGELAVYQMLINELQNFTKEETDEKASNNPDNP